MTDLWERDRHFRVPTYEVADQIRFKLKETYKKIFLFPDETEERPDQKKSGCPFAVLGA